MDYPIKGGIPTLERRLIPKILFCENAEKTLKPFKSLGYLLGNGHKTTKKKTITLEMIYI